VLQGLTHKNDGAADPKSLDKSSHLYRDLVSDGGAMPSFGMDLAKSVLSDHASLLAATPFVALILAMVAFQYIAQRQVSSRAPETDNPQAQQMQVIQKFLPPVFGVFSLGFPAALVLYWTMQSLFRMGQQWAMYRFDPALQTTVATANREVDEFLKEDTGSPKVKKSPTGPSNKSKGAKSAKNGNKKRKGR
jgi:membrane protein insertase Oxa1/YidC/SpoIIIJ